MNYYYYEDTVKVKDQGEFQDQGKGQTPLSRLADRAGSTDSQPVDSLIFAGPAQLTIDNCRLPIV